MRNCVNIEMRTHFFQTQILCLIMGLAILPGAAVAEILWNGHFDEHNLLRYHTATDPKVVTLHHMSSYGRAIQYGGQASTHVGNGDLLSLAPSPTRGSKYSAKFTVKSLAGGGVEPNDCDPATDCSKRRSQIQMTTTFTDYYKAIPYNAERWLSFSVFIPSDWDTSGSGFGPVIWGSKGRGAKMSGWAGLEISKEGWVFTHRFSKTMDTSEWWRSVAYRATYPNKSEWPAGLVDFPNVEASQAALANLNKGGWTDFLLHFKTDVRDVKEGNNGFLNVWMRAGSGQWIHVLNILPMKDLARNESWRTSYPERIYDRGIGHYASGGFGSNIGLYMDKGRVWSNSKNMSIYIDNYKVGNDRAAFELMTHDGSRPGQVGKEDTPPKSPKLLPVE